MKKRFLLCLLLICCFFACKTACGEESEDRIVRRASEIAVIKEAEEYMMR